MIGFKMVINTNKTNAFIACKVRTSIFLGGGNLVSIGIKADVQSLEESSNLSTSNLFLSLSSILIIFKGGFYE